MQCFEIVLHQDEKVKLKEQATSLFHGVIMTEISSVEAKRLHECQLSEFTINIEYSADFIFWTIWALTEPVATEIKKMLSDRKSFYLTNRGIDLKISSITHGEFKTPYQWFKDIALTELPSYLLIEFTSPTSFKSQGRYIQEANLQFIYQSVSRRVHSLHNLVNINKSAIELSELTRIEFSSIQKVNASLKSVKIRSFKGKLLINLVGSEEDRRIIFILWKLAEIFGVGIKTAMGMGQVNVKELYESIA